MKPEKERLKRKLLGELSQKWPLVTTGYAQSSTPRGSVGVSYVLFTYVAKEFAGATDHVRAI